MGALNDRRVLWFCFGRCMTLTGHEEGKCVECGEAKDAATTCLCCGQERYKGLSFCFRCHAMGCEAPPLYQRTKANCRKESR